jgi:hypothetical protein
MTKGIMQYLDLIFTNHALEQITRRGMKKEDAYEAFKHPDRTFGGKDGGTEFHKWFEGYEVTVIGKKNEMGSWVAISTWRNPPLSGTADSVKQSKWKDYKKAGFWGKVWINIKQQLGF